MTYQELNEAIKNGRKSFTGEDLRNHRFYGVDLVDADFSGADLRGARFGEINISFARFDGADRAGNAPVGDTRPTIAIVIGSEGGFSPEEAASAVDAGLMLTGLGRRILRTETAASFVLSCLSYQFEL